MNLEGKRVLVIVNPKSGRHTTNTQRFNITDLFCVGGLETTVYTTRGMGDATEIVRRRGEEFDILVCRGGDGTLNEMVNGVMQLKRQPILGYIPAGSTNDLAKTLSIPAENAEAIDIILHGRPLFQDVGRFDFHKYWVYTASFGALTDVAYDTPQALKNLFGHTAYLLQSLSSLRNIRPIHARVRTAEGFEEEGRYIFCSVSNSRSIAGSLRLKRKEVGLSDGLFELLLVRYPHHVFDIFRIASCLVARNLHVGGIQLIHSRRIEFTFMEDIPWTIDGEFAPGQRSIVIENVPRAIQLLQR